MPKTVIEIKNLKKYYGESRGVEDVSLKINEGTIYGFIGPNGAGKSTTIRALLGLINKNSGEILINGKEFDKDKMPPNGGDLQPPADGERPELPDGERPEKPEGGKQDGERPEKPDGNGGPKDGNPPDKPE